MGNFMTRYQLAVLLFSGLCLQSISTAQTKTIWAGVYSSEQAARGEIIYNTACIACHGKDLGGNSNSPGLAGMGFMFLWEGRTLGTFFEKIQENMPTDRPGKLPAQDYVDVVSYIMQANAFPNGDNELPKDLDALNDIAITARP